MFAVIKTGGKQFRVQEGDVLVVEKLDLEEGKKVTFDHVLLIEKGKNTLIGTPVVEKAQVIGEVEGNFKDKKVLVFKKKRRKQYRKTSGHRQQMTRIRIEKIVLGAEAPKKGVSAAKKLKPEEELEKLEAEVARKKPAKKREEPKPVEQKKPEAKAEAKKPPTKEDKPKKPKSPKKEEKPARKTAPKKKTKAEKPAVKKTAAKTKKATPKKEK